ncbi:MAG TPA: alpha/beta hydrolase [Steroidobacteraceae bacterium]
MPSKEHEEVLRHLRQVGALFANPAAGEPPYQSVRAAMQVLFTAPALESASTAPAALAAPKAEWVLAHGCDPDRRLLFLHGGGYIAGSIDTHRNLAMWTSRVSGCAVLLIDYRLAPEHPFPAAVLDAGEAFLWMRRHGPEGAAPARLAAVIGDSAGGGLTLALLLWLRERHPDSQADGAVTFSAWTDLSNTAPSLVTNQNLELGAVKSVVEYFSAQYLQGADPRDPLASPLFADLSALPPLLMQVSTTEIISDDSLRFAAKVRASGGRVDLQSWHGLVHVWQGYVPLLPEASEALERAGAFIRSL